MTILVCLNSKSFGMTYGFCMFDFEVNLNLDVFWN